MAFYAFCSFIALSIGLYLDGNSGLAFMLFTLIFMFIVLYVGMHIIDWYDKRKKDKAVLLKDRRHHEK